MRRIGALAAPRAWSAVVGTGLVVVLVAVGASAIAACGGDGAAEEAVTAPATTVATAKWDLVAIGDSTPGGYGVLPDEVYTRVYARMLADELGVGVTVRDHATWAQRTLADWYGLVRSDDSLKHDLAGAEVVTLFVGPHDFVDALMGGCTGAWPDPLEACFRAATASIPRDFDRLLGAIRGVVPERATILVGYDGGLPLAFYEDWSSRPYWPAMKRIFVDEWRPGLQAAAKAHNATIIPLNDATHGKDGKPLQPELSQSDKVHFNREGHQFLAELHAANDGIGDK